MCSEFIIILSLLVSATIKSAHVDRVMQGRVTPLIIICCVSEPATDVCRILSGSFCASSLTSVHGELAQPCGQPLSGFETVLLGNLMVG